MIVRFELSTEFTRWEQRLDARNAASTGMKPEESLATHGLLVAANYRPTGMKPVVAKHRKKCFTAFHSTTPTLHHSTTPTSNLPPPACSNFKNSFRDGKNGKTALLHSVQVGFRTSYVTGSDKWNTHRVSFNGYRCTSSLPKSSSQYST